MQVAEQRTGRRTRARRSDASGRPAVVAAGDDLALLSALPIAAAVIARGDDGSPKILAHNSRFAEAIALSTCTTADWNDAECLKTGPISELFEEYFNNPCSAGELDLKDGDGVAARYLRIKLAPLPKDDNSGSRCLMSLVDRTVEVQAERTLRAEMLRDSLTG
jgi:hypothetical protein